MATQSSSWNMAALRALLPRHSACLPPCRLLHMPFLPKHLTANPFNKCGALDMKPVGFFKGSPASVSWPSWH